MNNSTTCASLPNQQKIRKSAITFLFFPFFKLLNPSLTFKYFMANVVELTLIFCFSRSDSVK